MSGEAAAAPVGGDADPTSSGSSSTATAWGSKSSASWRGAGGAAQQSRGPLQREGSAGSRTFSFLLRPSGRWKVLGGALIVLLVREDSPEECPAPPSPEVAWYFELEEFRV